MFANQVRCLCPPQADHNRSPSAVSIGAILPPLKKLVYATTAWSSTSPVCGFSSARPVCRSPLVSDVHGQGCVWKMDILSNGIMTERVTNDGIAKPHGPCF